MSLSHGYHRCESDPKTSGSGSRLSGVTSVAAVNSPCHVDGKVLEQGTLTKAISVPSEAVKLLPGNYE